MKRVGIANRMTSDPCTHKGKQKACRRECHGNDTQLLWTDVPGARDRQTTETGESYVPDDTSSRKHVFLAKSNTTAI